MNVKIFFFFFFCNEVGLSSFGKINFSFKLFLAVVLFTRAACRVRNLSCCGDSAFLVIVYVCGNLFWRTALPVTLMGISLMHRRIRSCTSIDKCRHTYAHAHAHVTSFFHMKGCC